MNKLIATLLIVLGATGLMAFGQQVEVQTEGSHTGGTHPASATADASTQHQEKADSAWLDITNCEICKNMSSQEGLMESMKWETHVIPNGMMHFTVVPDEVRPKLDAAEKGMKQTIAEIMQGQKKQCCGYCTSIGRLMMAGAEQTSVRTAGGDVILVTSSEPAVIEMIQSHAKKTKDEYAKMMAAHTAHEE